MQPEAPRFLSLRRRSLPQSAPSPMLAPQSDALTHATRKLLVQSPQRDPDLGKPARLEDVALPIVKHARRLRKHLRSCFLMITSTSKSITMPGAQTKAPRKPGRSRYSPGQSLRRRPCLAYLQELAGICDRNR